MRSSYFVYISSEITLLALFIFNSSKYETNA